MKILIGKMVMDGKKVDACWTDETSSSRYGIGTIEIGNQDYGPADLVPEDECGRTIAQWLVDSCAWGDRYGRKGFYSSDELSVLKRFCSQWPEGPQL